MKKRMTQAFITTLVLSSALAAQTLVAQSQSDCYAMAQAYYEQVYCDIKSQSNNHGLPPIYEFKRNDSTTQALLLRRPARKLGIDVPIPKAQRTRRSNPVSSTSPTERETRVTTDVQPEAEPQATDQAPSRPLSNCTLVDTLIQCSDKQYQLLGNQSNDDLAPGALSPANKMELPPFDVDPNNGEAVRLYLHKAYQRYIEQMLAIGLGGATTSYGRFVFLFEDIQSKGLDFSDRFETMYTFLKKDKASMGVNTKPTTDRQLQLEDCDPLSPELLVCSREGRNYVYRRKSQLAKDRNERSQIK